MIGSLICVALGENPLGYRFINAHIKKAENPNLNADKWTKIVTCLGGILVNTQLGPIVSGT